MQKRDIPQKVERLKINAPELREPPSVGGFELCDPFFSHRRLGDGGPVEGLPPAWNQERMRAAHRLGVSELPRQIQASKCARLVAGAGWRSHFRHICHAACLREAARGRNQQIWLRAAPLFLANLMCSQRDVHVSEADGNHHQCMLRWAAQA